MSVLPVCKRLRFTTNMPNKDVKSVLERLISVEAKFNQHLIEGGGIKKDLEWLKWINMGIAALVLLKLVADWIIAK